MGKRKIYIAGPMTGYPEFNFRAFDAARDDYEVNNYEVFSPADHDRMLLGKPKNWMPQETDSLGPWKAWNVPNPPGLRVMLGADLNFICKEADAIYMLKGWERSFGARAEHATATALGLQIIYE